MMSIVLLGAGGTGMSGVAGMLQDLGYSNIVCIDGFQSQLTDTLKSRGLKTIIGHGKYTIQLDDIIIYSEAVKDCVEIQEAKILFQTNKKVLKIWNYFQFLGEISKYFISIGVAGTNGKSSTTSLGIYTFNKLNKKFGLGILGALVPQFDNHSYLINQNIKPDLKNIFDYIITGRKLNYENIKKYYFIVESCEYKRHFLYLDLDYSIVTNIELDHTDYFKDLNDYQNAFSQLITNTRHKTVVMKDYIKDFESITKEKSKLIETTTIHTDFKYILGKHNQINASLFSKLIQTILPKTQLDKIQKIMGGFKGLRRRMEYLGKNTNGSLIYSDYGHMASSIQLGYDALKTKYPNHSITVIFQPHQINRIETGRNDFIRAFQGYNKIFIYDIYAARESLDTFKKFKINSIEELGNNFAKACGGSYITDFGNIHKIIENGQDNQIIVIYSAGDIDYKIRQNINFSK